MKRKTVVEKYFEKIQRQKELLEEFICYETDWAKDLIKWYKIKKKEIPDDEYRACAYFINKEYLHKTGSLTLLYQMFDRCNKELPECNRENAFDLLRFKYKMYAKSLKEGGFDCYE